LKFEWRLILRQGPLPNSETTNLVLLNSNNQNPSQPTLFDALHITV
jgi:hypothetical protein